MRLATVALLTAPALLLATTPALAQYTPIAAVHALPADLTPRVSLQSCGDFEGQFGPLDYRTADPRDRRVVERYHFDMELRTFLAGKLQGKNRAGSGSVVGGFNYVLKAIPNHPAALLVMEQYAQKMKSDEQAEYPLECYYLRAFMIAPNDPAVRAMYGIFLGHRGRAVEARTNLDLAASQPATGASVLYHVGFGYLDLKQYEAAQRSAVRAARLGYPLDALEKAIRQAGKWNDALVVPDEAGDPAEPPAAGASVAAGSPPDAAASASASASAPVADPRARANRP